MGVGMTDDMLFIPSIRENETLYSFCATAASVNSRRSSTRVSMNLLGVRDGMLQHEMLGRVDALHAVMGTGAPSVERLFSKHTLLSFYWPFSDASVRGRMLAYGPTMAGGLLRAIGASSRTASVSHPLKWCEACQAEDRRCVGRAYWHVDHQFPLSWYCCKHERPLRQVPRRSRLWHLPPSGESPSLAEAALGDAFESEKIALSRVGQAISQLSDVSGRSLRSSAQDRLRQLGILHQGDYAHHHRVSAWFSSTRMARMLKDSSGSLALLANGKWIPTQVFRSRRDSAIRWAIFWATMSGELGVEPELLVADACSGVRTNGTGQTQLFPEIRMALRAPDHVWACLAHANCFEEAAQEIGATRHDLGRWLKADPELARTWKARLRELRLERAKANIEELLRQEPGVKSSEIERRLQADVHWLRQHAPSVLSRIRQGLIPRGAVQRSLFDA